LKRVGCRRSAMPKERRGGPICGPSYLRLAWPLWPVRYRRTHLRQSTVQIANPVRGHPGWTNRPGRLRSWSETTVCGPRTFPTVSARAVPPGHAGDGNIECRPSAALFLPVSSRGNTIHHGLVQQQVSVAEGKRPLLFFRRRSVGMNTTSRVPPAPISRNSIHVRPLPVSTSPPSRSTTAGPPPAGLEKYFGGAFPRSHERRGRSARRPV